MSQEYRPWKAIAADAARQADELRVAALAKDLERWREIVESIATGHEPDGVALAEISRLAAVLVLPDGALADDVAAMAAARRADEQLARVQAAREEAERDGAKIAEEIEAARARIRELEADRANRQRLMLTEGERIAATHAARQRHPRLFADPAMVAKKVIESASGRAWAKEVSR